MIIEEKDFRIIFNEDHYVLYLLKSKKEIKEDSSDTFKIGGYFVNLRNAIKRAYKFRTDKKYPGKELSETIKLDVKEYMELESRLFKSLKISNTLINNLSEKILTNEIS